MGFMAPKMPKPPPPAQPLAQIDQASKSAQTEQAKQAALMRGIESTWNDQSMMSAKNGFSNPANEKKTTLG